MIDFHWLETSKHKSRALTPKHLHGFSSNNFWRKLNLRTKAESWESWIQNALTLDYFIKLSSDVLIIHYKLRYYVPVKSKLQHPPPGQPPRHLNFWRLANVQIPSPRGKKAVQMPHQLALKYLSSKTNFIFNQTLFTLFRERCAVMRPSDFFETPFWKNYSLTKAKFCLVNPSNLAKTDEKTTVVLRQNKR